ncbi:hypothetical protein GOV07_04275 [Candidatus Woesearchaeota archaeon]|nr:hypothetical protein [Candidatus Woesearchaeota archaeon]
MIESHISLPYSEALLALLNTEEFTHPRASYDVKKDGKNITITIEAKDATALKTAVSSVCRVVTVYEKA